MKRTAASWPVLPHRPLEELAENLWRVEGDLEGMPLTRAMTIARRMSGGLVIHNAIALDEETMARIDAWGPVETVLVPSAYHRIDAPRFKERYPNAQFLCPASARAKVAGVIAVDGSYNDFGADEAISLETLDGTSAREGVMTVRSAVGATLVFNDMLFNIPHAPGFHGFVFRYITRSSAGPRVTRLARLALVKDVAKLRAHLERLARTENLARVIVSHGAVVERRKGDEAAAMIRTAIATLD